MPWGDAMSSANGVAMPGTPPIIDPLPPSEVAPDTQRDTQLAMRAERRRWGTLGVIAAVIAAVAVGGYLAGKRSHPAPTAATPTAPTAAVVVPAPAPRGLATPATATNATPAAATTASAATTSGSSAGDPAPSASASSSAVPPRPLRRLKKPIPAASGETKPEEPPPPAVPENPFADP